jgi:aryl-alcohol dehydrogenase-like predicted oxidoreductase
MEMRQLGRSGLKVAPWCFGGNVFGWTADEAMSFRLLDAFVGDGFNFIDTADVYSRWAPGNKGGESEIVIGKWLAQRRNRDRVVIATKVGMEMGPGKDNLSKAYITEAVEASLMRLQTDYIDLYQSHRDDEKTPIGETLETYAALVKSGKVRVLGASNFSTERLAASLDLSQHDGLPRYESLQPEYNLYSRTGFETSLQALCVEREVGVIPYWSLASGFLTGKYRSEADFGKSPRGQSMKKYLDERGLRILKALDEVSEAHSAGQAEVALAWLLAQPSITAPIASATRVEQLASLAKSAELTLSADDLDKLNQASAG